MQAFIFAVFSTSWLLLFFLDTRRSSDSVFHDLQKASDIDVDIICGTIDRMARHDGKFNTILENCLGCRLRLGRFNKVGECHVIAATCR